MAEGCGPGRLRAVAVLFSSLRINRAPFWRSFLMSAAIASRWRPSPRVDAAMARARATAALQRVIRSPDMENLIMVVRAHDFCRELPTLTPACAFRCGSWTNPSGNSRLFSLYRFLAVGVSDAACLVASTCQRMRMWCVTSRILRGVRGWVSQQFSRLQDSKLSMRIRTRILRGVSVVNRLFSENTSLRGARSCGKMFDMRVRVECYAGRVGDERVRFRLDSHEYMVEEVLDHWYGPEHIFFKVRANDGNIYILRRDTSVADEEWKLVSFRA